MLEEQFEVMMENVKSRKVGVYVDVSNIAMNGGFGMQYDVLREFASRNNGVCMRLNAYVAYDEDRAKKDIDYRKKSNNFQSVLRDFGYKVIVKNVKWFVDEDGHRFAKANSDLDMAVDALLQSEKLDYVIMLTGDGDFVQVVRALQNKGCRVEVISFKNVSQVLKREADSFVSGYLIPDLLPMETLNESLKWGQNGSRVRGVCYSYHQDKGYGFMRVIKHFNKGLWIIDSRKEESPYQTVFFHITNLPDTVDTFSLPYRDQIFEFDLFEEEKGMVALNIKSVN